MAEPAWRKANAGNYSTRYVDGKGNVIQRVGKNFILSTKGGAKYNLGAKASFTTANAALRGTPMRGTKTLQSRAVKVKRVVRTRTNYQRGSAYRFTRTGRVSARQG